jgi:hypothetical protein
LIGIFRKGKVNFINGIGLNGWINKFGNKLALEVLSNGWIRVCEASQRWPADLEEELLRSNIQGFLAGSLKILRET